MLPLDDGWDGSELGVITDPDAIVRASETDPAEALERLVATYTPRLSTTGDWPDELARTLQRNPALCLTDWAREYGLHRASLSRGFTQTFGTTPAAYRLAQRTRRAIDGAARAHIPLSRVAIDCGFSDQAHMTRAVTNLAGMTPGQLRRRKSVG